VWSVILDSAVRPVVIVLFDPTSDRGSRFFQASILRCPDFLFLKTAMEPFNVTIAFRVMVGRASMRDAQPVQGLDEPGRSELCAVVGGQRYAGLAAALGSRSSTACSTAASASSVRQRCERFQPTISRVQQSITHTR